MSNKTTVLVIGAASVLESALCQQLQQTATLLQADDADQVIDITSESTAIDLLILDVNSLGDAAHETSMWLKTDKETKYLPLVVLGNDGADIERWLNAGACDYLDAQNQVALMVTRIKTLLELRYKTTLLESVASLDPLTSVADRHRLEEYIGIEWRRSLREYYPLSLIKLDIDHFTQYNDHYGLGKGDEVLKRVARLIEQHIHRAGDMVARFVADEFFVLLPATELESALLVAERMVTAIEDLAIPHEYSAIADMMTASAGVATIEPSRDKRYQDLFDEAEEMLYRARQKGANQAQGISL